MPDPVSTWLTVPNVLTAARVVGTACLPGLAAAGLRTAFVVLLAVLLITDWLDGKLAILLRQRTELGARLDSAADVLLYAVLVSCLFRLRPDFVRSDWPLLVATGASYAIAAGVGLARFRRLPAHHTRAAKTCWLLTGVAAIALYADGPAWPARVAMAAVILTNVEGAVISLVLPRWRTDTPSLYHAVVARRERPGGP